MKKEGFFRKNSNFNLNIMIDIDTNIVTNDWVDLVIELDVTNNCSAFFRTTLKDDLSPSKSIICGENINGKFQNMHLVELNPPTNTTLSIGRV